MSSWWGFFEKTLVRLVEFIYLLHFRQIRQLSQLEIHRWALQILPHLITRWAYFCFSYACYSLVHVSRQQWLHNPWAGYQWILAWNRRNCPDIPNYPPLWSLQWLSNHSHSTSTCSYQKVQQPFLHLRSVWRLWVQFDESLDQAQLCWCWSCGLFSFSSFFILLAYLSGRGFR